MCLLLLFSGRSPKRDSESFALDMPFPPWHWARLTQHCHLSSDNRGILERGKLRPNKDEGLHTRCSWLVAEPGRHRGAPGPCARPGGRLHGSVWAPKGPCAPLPHLLLPFTELRRWVPWSLASRRRVCASSPSKSFHFRCGTFTRSTKHHTLACTRTRNSHTPRVYQRAGRGPGHSLLRRGQTDGQQTREKVLQVTRHQRNANTNHSDTSPHTPQNGHRQTTRAGTDVGDRQPSCPAGGTADGVAALGNSTEGPQNVKTGPT